MPRTYRLRSRPAPSGQKTDFAALLNEQQLAAVTSPIGASLVIAGAGSGKTRTLTHRVAYLIEEGMPARNILLLTFTNKAAREMLDRVEEIITLDRLSLWGGTFHSIGNRILRRHADLIGYRKNFSIMDREDQRSLLLQAFKESGLPERVLKDKRFPKAKVLADIFSMAENLACDLEEILEARYDHLAEHWEEIGTVRTAYEKKKLATNVMDFDDLLTKTLNLLEENAAICEGYQNQFRAILVDEYQDTNPVQSRLIDLLAQKHGHLMVVGDDAQSIYSWRGADFRNILGFSDRYPDAKTYKIETNYRSVPEVLTLANEVISQNEEQFPKELQPARESADNLPVLVPVEDPNFQAQFISQRIEDFQAEGVELNEIAILYRAHFHSMEIQMALTRLGLPYRITSGVRFFEQAHLKDVCSFIRFTVNPRDEVAFQRMVKLIPGIGDITADKLWQAWLGCGASTEEEPPESYSKLLEGFRVP
ncbi:MAG: ATP-dependent helicase, partial [Verrucomicrobiota bacterium]